MIIPKSGRGTIHPDAFKVLTNLYGKDIDIFLRELSSNGFNHGKCDQVDWFYNAKTGEIIYSDNGIGFTPETKKYFYGLDVGQSGYKENRFNRWRVGINSVFLVADTIVINIKSKQTGEEIQIKRSNNGDYTTEEIQQKLENSGVTYHIPLNDESKKVMTLQSIEDGLKKYNYWNIVHGGKKVTLNGKPIIVFGGDGKISYGKYGDGNTIDGLQCSEIHKINDIDSNGFPIVGEVFLDIEREKQPSWMPKSGCFGAFIDGDFVEDNNRVIHASLSIIANTQDTKMLDKLNAGKTTLKGFKGTEYYRNVLKYVQQWVDRTGVHSHEDVLEFLHDIISEFDISNLGTGGIKTKVPPIVPSPFPKSTSPFPSATAPPRGKLDYVEMYAPEAGFMWISSNGTTKQLNINCKCNSPPVYPNLTKEWDLLILNQKNKQWKRSVLMSLFSRIADDIENYNDFANNEEMYSKKYKSQDGRLEKALEKVKKTENIENTEEL